MKTWWSHGGGFVVGKTCGTFATCSPMFALAPASADCFCGCNYVCICVCIGCVQVCMCLQVSIAFALVLRLCLHLHCTCVCSGVAMLLALQWCCTWVALVSVCFVPSEFRKETLKNPHLLWHLLAVVCRCGFRLRLHGLELHRRELHCFERTAVALACIAAAE